MIDTTRGCRPSIVAASNASAGPAQRGSSGPAHTVVGAAGSRIRARTRSAPAARHVTDEQDGPGPLGAGQPLQVELADHLGGPPHLRPRAGQRPQQVPVVAARDQLFVVEELRVKGHRL